MKLRLFEAFAGIGSQAEALKELGIEFESVGISDIDKHAIAGYEAIHGPVKNYGDITKIEHLPECDLLTYSYPCTSISLAGKREGMVEGSGTASSLLWEIGRLLKDMQERGVLPEILLMENVDAVLNRVNKPEFDRWCLLLTNMGYVNSYAIMNAKDYGTPQNRRRIFMVSSLSYGEFIFPEPCPDGRVLRDVLEKNVPESYFLSEKRIATFKRHKERNDAKGNGFGFKVHEITDEVRERERGDVSASVTNSADRYCATWIGIPKSECQQEAGESDGIVTEGVLDIPNWHNAAKGVVGPSGASPTICAQSNNLRTKVMIDKGQDLVVVGNLNEPGHYESEQRVYSENGGGPTVTTNHAPIVECSDVIVEGDLNTPGWQKHANTVYNVNGSGPTVTVTHPPIIDEYTNGSEGDDTPKSSSKGN